MFVEFLFEFERTGSAQIYRKARDGSAFHKKGDCGGDTENLCELKQ
jgi:hypothetical protein